MGFFDKIAKLIIGTESGYDDDGDDVKKNDKNNPELEKDSEKESGNKNNPEFEKESKKESGNKNNQETPSPTNEKEEEKDEHETLPPSNEIAKPEKDLNSSKKENLNDQKGKEISTEKEKNKVNNKVEEKPAPIKNDKGEESQEKEEETLPLEQTCAEKDTPKPQDLSNEVNNIDEDSSKSKKDVATNSEDDPIQKQNKILKGIIAIAQEYRINKISVDNKSLRIISSDKITYDILVGSNFVETVKQDIFDQEGLVFGNGIDIALEKNIDEEWTNIYPNVYVAVNSNGVQPVIKKASIKIIVNSGSLLKDIYILSSEEIKSLPQKRYNIGIGAETLTNNNRLRINQIALDDNPNSPYFAYNRYASRAHAHIEYSEEHGFLLYAEHGGTTLGGKRTRIYRTNAEIKLENPLIPEPLHDGDVIELTKKIKLLFSEIKD